MESDFLPAGHPPRSRRRHAPGQAGVYLGRGQTQRFVFELKEGDHVDLLASIPVDMPGGPFQFRAVGGQRHGDAGHPPAAEAKSRQALGAGWSGGIARDGPHRPTTNQFGHEWHDHPQRAGAGDRDRRGARRSGAAGRGHGLEIRDHLRGAFGPPGAAAAGRLPARLSQAVAGSTAACATGRSGHASAPGTAGRDRSQCEAGRRRHGPGGGHHARTRPHGRGPFHGSHDWDETAIRALQRTGEQPCRGTARRRIGQGRCGGRAGGPADGRRKSKEP